MQQDTRAEKPQSQIDMALGAIDKRLCDQGEAIARLQQALEPISATTGAAEENAPTRENPGGSTIVRRLWELEGSIANKTVDLRTLTDSLEL